MMNKISRMLGLVGEALTHPREVAKLVKRNYANAKDEGMGKAVSKARMILNARWIPEVVKFLHPERRGLVRRFKGRGPFIPQRIKGARIRMLDGKLYDFFSDGSLRHAFGRKIGKMARKALKRQHTRERLRNLPLLAN